MIEREIDLEVAIATDLPPNGTSSAYPFPPLAATGRTERRSFRGLVLSNELIEATILPELGGRLIRLLDKRTGTEVLPQPPALALVPGGRRWVVSPWGIQVCLDGQERLNATGPIDSSIEADAAAVWIAESSAGPICFHLRIELPSDRAELLLECRAFNRSLAAVSYNGGLLVGDGLQAPIALQGGALLWGGSSGLAVFSEELSPFLRFSGKRAMGPRQVDTWRAVLTPFSGFSAPPFVCPGLGVGFDGGQIRLQASRELQGHKLVLLTEGGETLEAMAGLTAEREVLLSTGADRPPKELAVLTPDREIVLRIDPYSPPRAIESLPDAEPEPLPDLPNLDASPAELKDAGFRMRDRALGCLLQGIQRLQAGDPVAAEELFEQALLYNGDDPLCWWAKAVAARLRGEEEGPELPNAHYLAPLEPVLRAEALLRQPHRDETSPNPMLSPLMAVPSNFVEAACCLVEMGLLADAARWIGEALRHVDLPMLRYLVAYCLLTGSRMEVEAAEQVAAAGRVPLSAPYPWRSIEKTALAALRKRFPSDRRLGEYASLAGV